MRRRWIRLRPGREENVRAASLAFGAAAGVAAAVFYFARILLSREEVRPLERAESPEEPAPAARGEVGRR